jgi:hypothetical protein
MRGELRDALSALPAEVLADASHKALLDAFHCLAHNVRGISLERGDATWSTSDVAVCLLQCLSKVSGTLRKVGSALTQFVEQPRILDGGDSLIRKCSDQLDLFLSKLSHLRPGDYLRVPSTSSLAGAGTSTQKETHRAFIEISRKIRRGSTSSLEPPTVASNEAAGAVSPGISF